MMLLATKLRASRVHMVKLLVKNKSSSGITGQMKFLIFHHVSSQTGIFVNCLKCRSCVVKDHCALTFNVV